MVYTKPCIYVKLKIVRYRVRIYTDEKLKLSESGLALKGLT